MTLTAPAPSVIEEAPLVKSQRKRADEGQFCLQVDRQTKRCFKTLGEAEEAGMAIKISHPILHVAVYNTADCVNTVIKLAEKG